jgi:hypothetical protein
MQTSYDFNLRSARASESKVETLDWFLSRQTPQRISTGLGLISLALGFWLFAMLIFINWHQAEPNGLSGAAWAFHGRPPGAAVLGGVDFSP